MKKATFRWYLKKRLTEATPTGTLNLKKLSGAAERDENLRVSLALYLSAYLTQEEAEHRLAGSPILSDYGKFYYESGIPGRDALRTMPEPYHRVYDDYIRYTAERRANVRIKTKCRRELLGLLERRGLSQRQAGQLCEVDFACISRFLQGGDYALGAERLKHILNTLRGMERVQMRNARLYIDDYNKTELAEGLIEVSFTLNISEEALAALRQLCQENDISFPTLLENFLTWLITEQSGEWVRKQQKRKE